MAVFVDPMLPIKPGEKKIFSNSLNNRTHLPLPNTQRENVQTDGNIFSSCVVLKRRTRSSEYKRTFFRTVENAPKYF